MPDVSYDSSTPVPKRELHPEALNLAKAFINDFYAANHDIRWLALEQELSLWLDEKTVLIGKVDAQGLTCDGEPFFGDWKTGSKKKARFIESEKRQWRMNPQALTYGVLLGTDTFGPNANQAVRRFTVRWALKTEPIKTDFEWYTYTEDELEFWHLELLDVASKIRAEREADKVWDGAREHWPTNLLNCTRYGESYACPFRDEGCWKLKFDFMPPNMVRRGAGHLAIEADVRRNAGPDLVVLDASRVGDWISCSEYYRRLWEGKGLTEENENLEIGSDFHELIAAHLGAIKGEQDDATK